MDMNMTQGLVQQQKLIMTTEMQHALKILQMSIHELQKDINKALEENPLLDIYNEEISQPGSLNENEVLDLSKFVQHRDDVMKPSSTMHMPDPIYADPYNYAIQKKTLKEYLKDQLLCISTSPKIHSLCQYIIENIDHKGYLSCSLNEIANDLMIPLCKVEYALKMVQTFDPIGVGARDLHECLKIQLEKSGIENKILYLLIDEHLEDIAKNHVKEISILYHLEWCKVQEYFDVIKSLEPKPARGFYTGETNPFIIPEAYIRKIDGGLYIFINNQALPKLTVNQLYKNILHEDKDRQTSEFVKTKLNNALFLIKGIQQRYHTIYNILNIIVDIQKDYFIIGRDHLKPMTISQISSRLELNESTVSRAIKDKYISTPYSTILIKKLFTSGLQGTQKSQDTVSSNYVKTLIKDMIEKEDPHHPLSDQCLCNLLKEQYIKISRRTVAKYREEMELGSSNQRKIYV
ncbi:MAG: RNA polymerase factor sigma-54 [Eubacteriales bacterium]